MILRLAWSQLWRNRTSSEFRILSVAFALAIFAVTLLTCLTQGLGDLFEKDATSLLGADLIIESPHPFPAPLVQALKNKSIRFSESVEFFSMLSQNDKMQLANVNSIASPFPLRGQLVILTATGSQEVTHAPPEGEIWLEDALMSKLEARLNDALQIGSLRLKITGVIQKRPLALSSSNMLAPLCYINNQDLNKMAVLQPGSRATYRLLLKVEPSQSKGLQSALNPLLPKEANWVTPQSGRRGLSQTIVTVQQYLSVILLIQVLLAGIAIAICAHEFSVRKKRTVALMRCLGATSRTIFLVHFLELVFLAAILLLFSIGLGYGVASILLSYSKSFLGIYSVALNSQGAIFGILTGSLLLFGFALPPIYELRKVSPSQIFQGSFATNMGVHFLSYTIALVSLIFLFLTFVNDSDIAIQLCIHTFILGAVTYAIAYGLWFLFVPFKRYGSLAWRFGVTYLVRHRSQTISQWLIFTLVIMLLLLVQIIKHDFVHQWRTQLPKDTPNYFLMNVQNDQIESLNVWLKHQNMNDAIFYPIVRGRMTHINGLEVGPHRGLSRPINLTWMSEIPKDNIVLEGYEWVPTLSGQAVISIESKFAERQGLNINDTVTFQIDNEAVAAKIIQIRNLEWTSFRPNFFVIFPDKILNDFPHSYITSIYLPPNQKTALFALAKEYVELSIIDIDDILQSVRTMVDKLTVAIDGLLLMVFVLGILIMYSSLLITLKDRMQESAMLQILGAKKAFIAKLLVIEFGLLGLFSGIVGSGIAMLLAKGLAARYFSVEFHLSISWFCYGTLLSTCVIALFGIIGARKVFQVSPLWLLRQST